MLALASSSSLSLDSDEWEGEAAVVSLIGRYVPKEDGEVAW
jgi:hypothetical protein